MDEMDLSSSGERLHTSVGYVWNGTAYVRETILIR